MIIQPACRWRLPFYDHWARQARCYHGYLPNSWSIHCVYSRVGEDQDYAESDERFYQAPIPEGSAVMDSCNLISLYVVI